LFTLGVIFNFNFLLGDTMMKLFTFLGTEGGSFVVIL